jgi:hypothetical protein
MVKISLLKSAYVNPNGVKDVETSIQSLENLL